LTVADPEVEQVVIMTSAQVGKTEILNNVLGYYIAHEPSPILVIQPTLQMGEDWSKDRLAPMLRDTDILRQVVGDPRAKATGSTLKHKSFPGGHVTVTGANSPSSLASRPIRVLLLDEVDKYPASAGASGDPVNLAMMRTSTMWNRKILLTSTPGIKGASRIEHAYEQSSQHRYYVPCPECRTMQRLHWRNVKWDERNPLTARVECEECRHPMYDQDIGNAIREGEWRPDCPEVTKVRGFHINELYSPWVALATTVGKFLEAKDGGPEMLKQFINERLGESWEEEGTSVEPHALYANRREHYASVPEGAKWLTCGVDVQIDRIECEVVAWAPNRESWSMDYRVFHGDPRVGPSLPGSPWHQLDELLDTTFDADGEGMSIARTFVDSGAFTDHVYAYTRPRQSQGVYAIKGIAGEGRAQIASRSQPGALRARVFTLGVDGIKATLYSRLSIEEPGEPGYCHFPLDYDLAYFQQLTAERLVRRMHRGFSKYEWTLKPNARNEALDCRVYATAALDHIAPARSLLIARPDKVRATRSPGAPRAKRYERKGLFA
jgi:phage terminase large subunit GpA-like protein